MPDENRVFDVARPGHGHPQATSKPVIVGHQPVRTDPMMRDESKSVPSKIAVFHDEPEAKPDDLTEPLAPAAGPESGMEHHDIPVYKPADEPDLEPSPQAAEVPAPAVYDSQPESSGGVEQFSSAQTAYPKPLERGGTAPLDPKPVEPVAPPPGHVEALRPSPHMKRRSPLKWLLLLLLVGLIAAYVLVGSGVIKTSLNLPPFKHNMPAPAASSQSQAPASQQPTLPNGFNQYTIAGTSVTFAAPSSWGRPISTTDPGYSKRGGSNQTDGTHAYLVDFPSNKDVEIAITSAKYLPAARDAQYYDYLQWCTGTADGKYYFSTLQFTTDASKVDTPTTTVCNQGPISGVTQINASTIVQLSAKNNSGQLLGDLYTKNLTSPDLPVVRILDAKSANATQIKQILATFKVPS